VLSGWADEPLEQIPLKVGRVTVAGTGAHETRLITAFHADTILQARLAAVRAALSWYVGTCPDRRDVVVGTATGPVPDGQRIVADARLTTWSGLRPAPDAPRRYLPAVSLLTGTAVLVPQAAVYPFSAANADAGFERTTAGAAAGRSVSEVTTAGLDSALAYRGLLAAVRGTDPGYEITDQQCDQDEQARFVRASMAHLGQRVRTYALPGARPGYAVLATIEGTAVWTVGAALSPTGALRAALRDALGQAQLLAAEHAAADLGDPLLADFDPRTRWTDVEAGPWETSAPPVDIDQALARLADDGLDAFLVDTTTDDLRAVPAIRTGTVLLATRPDDPG
jgi:hypothetical protein